MKGSPRSCFMMLCSLSKRKALLSLLPELSPQGSFLPSALRRSMSTKEYLGTFEGVPSTKVRRA